METVTKPQHTVKQNLTGVVGSIVSAWDDEIERSWYEKKCIENIEDIEMYIKEIVKC